MTEAAQDAPAAGGFIEPVAMEADPTALFAGDTGTLDAEARVVLVDLLRRRYLSAENPQRWHALLEHQSVIESRLHDLFVTLVVDRDRGIAYKRQVRSGEVEIPILLRDEAFTRVETVLLVQLRTLHQREQGAGEIAARVDAEELEQHVLSFLDPAETNIAARQKEIWAAITRLAKEGFLDEETPGRFRVTPLVEVVLPVDRLVELAEWMRTGGVVEPALVAPVDSVPDDGDTDDGDTDDGDVEVSEEDGR